MAMWENIPQEPEGYSDPWGRHDGQAKEWG